MDSLGHSKIGLFTFWATNLSSFQHCNTIAGLSAQNRGTSELHDHFMSIVEQEGFRCFQGTSDAFLRLRQDIFDGFNQREPTAALFIDLEKAYDSVWRNGLMVKLEGMDICGRIWRWIRSFLTDW